MRFPPYPQYHRKWCCPGERGGPTFVEVILENEIIHFEKPKAMTKQILFTVFSILCFCFSTLNAQQVHSFQEMKKNGIYVEPIPAISAKKELRFGYERMLSRHLTLNLGMGIGLKNDDPGLSTGANEQVASTFTREGHSELTWILFIPIWTSSYSAPAPEEWEESKDFHHLKSHFTASAELKYYLTSDRRSKLPNGLYLAPGLTWGRDLYSVYHETSGSRNHIEVYDTRSNTWGLPILLGSSSDDWTERVSVIQYETRDKETKTHQYLHPYLRAGYQLPIGRHFAVDLSAQLLLKTGKEAFPEEDPFSFFGPSLKDIVQKSASLRISYRF